MKQKKTTTRICGEASCVTGTTAYTAQKQQASKVYASAQQWSLITNVDEIAHASYEQAEYALITGEDVGGIGAGKPGEIGYMPPDP